MSGIPEKWDPFLVVAHARAKGQELPLGQKWLRNCSEHMDDLPWLQEFSMCFKTIALQELPNLRL